MKFNRYFGLALILFASNAVALAEASQEESHAAIVSSTDVSKEASDDENAQVTAPEGEPVTLPKTFKAKVSGKARPWGTHRFQIDSTEETTSPDERNLNGKVLKESFWALRTILTLTDRSFASSFAVGYNSWFYWRTFNVFGEHNEYLGQINKHWFTCFSGVHRYDLRNKDGKVLATAQIEDSGNFTEIVMRSADKSYRKDQVVARFRLPRDYNPHLDHNNDYLAWNVKIDDHDQKFFSKERLDPRILSMFIPFVSSRDYTWN